MYPSTLLLGVLVAGLVLGFISPGDSELPVPYNTLTSLVGWVYTTAWSVSFYPQVILNWRRKSVTGLSFDFLGLNLIGWVCYSGFNVALYWFPAQVVGPGDSVRRLVELNDVVFALHALLLTSITVVQCFMYERGTQRLSRATRLLVITLAIVLVSYGAAIFTVGCQKCAKLLSWLSFVYFLSYVKMAITLVKYTPQLYFNYTRKSTVGWNVDNIILDFTGGCLSIAQVLLTSYFLKDWSLILGNPVKFGLGAVSIMFDVAFLLQHYVLYAEPRDKPATIPAAATIMPPAVASSGGSLLLEEGHTHSVLAILRHLVQHPELLPSDVCEEMCNQYAEHGIDVDVGAVLAHFAAHPELLHPGWVGSICCHCGALGRSSGSSSRRSSADGGGGSQQLQRRHSAPLEESRQSHSRQSRRSPMPATADSLTTPLLHT
jgi:LCT (Lysosomal Cystine Transporter) family transporter